MTLVLKPDLDMVNMYHHTKNEISMSRQSKIIVQNGQTHSYRQYENITFPHTLTVTRNKSIFGSITKMT